MIEKIDEKHILEDVMSRLKDIMKLRYNDIPNIDLYMDQVLTFMDERLSLTVRESEKEDTDHVLTKTMINNYAKSDLLPPPVKKKYNREHMITLILIYYFKSYLSINDIKTLLDPLTEKHFDKNSELPMGEIYEKIMDAGNERIASMDEDLRDTYESSIKLFEDVDVEDKEYLQLFSYVCSLSYDIFVKQMLVEKTLDEMAKLRSKDEEERIAAEKAARKNKK